MPPDETRRLLLCEVGLLRSYPQNRSAAMQRFERSSFGSFLDELFSGIFTRPSHRTFLRLSLGLVFAFTRHTVASYLWRAGAATLKHFTRFYVFLGAPCYDRLDDLFARVIIEAARYVPLQQAIRLRFDETTSKKSGRKIEGCSSYRNGAGTARQEWRTLFGLSFVIGEMRIRLPHFEGGFVSVPIGLRLYLKPDEAQTLGQPYRSRSELAREMLEQICQLVGVDRTMLSVQDGGYSTRQFLRNLPENAHVVGRLPVDSPLYGVPAKKAPGQPGPAAKKGPRLGTVKELAQAASPEHWQAHPTEAQTQVLVLEGIWHSVLPGVLLRVVIVRRARATRQKRALEAFFTTWQRLDLQQILCQYEGRWSVEILIREAREHYGLGQDRCRRYRRIVGVNGFRLLVGACQVLWFAREVEQYGPVALTPYQPWYEGKQVPSLHDIAWAVRERLFQEGITPKVGIWEAMGIIHHLRSETQTDRLPLAA